MDIIIMMKQAVHVVQQTASASDRGTDERAKMKTYPMLQQDATKEKPFYSVYYQYTQNPWTLWGHTHYKGHFKGTQSGTSSFEVAKAQAEKLVKQSGICFAQVSMTADCYNHKTVFEVRAEKTLTPPAA